MITPPVSRLDFQHFAVCPRAFCGGSVPFLASIWYSERLLIREEGRVQASRRHSGNLGFRQEGNITAFLSVSMAYVWYKETTPVCWIAHLAKPRARDENT